jgi:hypothetical protein
MACVVTFWQLPQEEDLFFSYVSRKDDVDAFPLIEAVADPGLIRAAPISQLVGRASDVRLYITPREYAASPKLFAFQPTSLDQPVRYSLASEFPALVYDRGSLKNGRLSQSNASAYTGYVDAKARVFHKMPAGFLSWLKRVMGWLRRAKPQWHDYPGYRATNAAAQAALSGLVLVPYHGWSGTYTGNSSFMPGYRGTLTARTKAQE